MVLVAIEDELSRAVAVKLANQVLGNQVSLQFVLGRGNGRLLKGMQKFRNAARSFPVWLLTDLDREKCPTALINRWTGGTALPHNFCFRVAVREIEAWLLADRVAFAEFMGISAGKIDRNPEAIGDPKMYILNLARNGKRTIRDDLLPHPNTAASQGFGYNQRLCHFVSRDWSPSRASEVSRSLKKAITRLAQLRMSA